MVRADNIAERRFDSGRDPVHARVAKLAAASGQGPDGRKAAPSPSLGSRTVSLMRVSSVGASSLRTPIGRGPRSRRGKCVFESRRRDRRRRNPRRCPKGVVGERTAAASTSGCSPVW